MKRLFAQIFVLGLTGCLCMGTSEAGKSGKVNAALKQITKATKGVSGVIAEVDYAEIVGKRPIEGSGKLYVSFDGRIRAEIGGDSPRTVLLVRPYLRVHRQYDKTVEVHDLTSNPHKLSQYALLGFSPAGSAMKKSYSVELVDNSKLDGKPVLSFLMTPKSEEVAGAIARIQLWVDPETGWPLRQKIVHATANTDLEIRYRSVVRNDELDPSLFVPDWPDDVKIERRR